MPVPYNKPGLLLSQTTANDPPLVRALQRDLRALGYLPSGIDGPFGAGTARAVRALQLDLLDNDGSSRGGDGRAPVASISFNDDGAGGKVINVRNAGPRPARAGESPAVTGGQA